MIRLEQAEVTLTELWVDFDGIFLLGSRRQPHGWKSTVRAIQEIDVGQNHRREKD